MLPDLIRATNNQVINALPYDLRCPAPINPGQRIRDQLPCAEYKCHIPSVPSCSGHYFGGSRNMEFLFKKVLNVRKIVDYSYAFHIVLTVP